MAATRRATAVALFAAAATTGFLYLYFVDPLTSPLAPPCLFTAVFGFRCPGCGSLRALHALAHGDVRNAWDLNKPLLIALLLAAAATLFNRLRRSSRSSFPPTAS